MAAAGGGGDAKHTGFWSWKEEAKVLGGGFANETLCGRSTRDKAAQSTYGYVVGVRTVVCGRGRGSR